jgi:hypothetical protein
MEKQFSKNLPTEKKNTREIKIELSSQLTTSFPFLKKYNFAEVNSFSLLSNSLKPLLNKRLQNQPLPPVEF